MSNSLPPTCLRSSCTIVSVSVLNTRTNCSSILKWNVGVMILRRWNHFSPLAISSPVPSQGSMNWYSSAFSVCFASSTFSTFLRLVIMRMVHLLTGYIQPGKLQQITNDRQRLRSREVFVNLLQPLALDQMADHQIYDARY
uniref:Uncharacterized protein n=1 Tax=Anopheles melas TaxID=34690 RepID=A0A182UDQ4_9DIPT